MSKKLSVRLNEIQKAELNSLYKLYQIKSETDADAFRKLLHAIYSEKTEKLESEEIIEEIPNCTLIPALIKSGKHKGEVYCPNPDIAGLKSGNFLPLEACQCCWWRRENSRELEGTPTSETTFAPDFDVEETQPKKPKTKTVQKLSDPLVQCGNPYCNKNFRRITKKRDILSLYCGWCRHHSMNYSGLKTDFLVGVARGTISPIRSSLARDEWEHMERINDGTIPAKIDPSEQRNCIDCRCDINHLEDWKTRCSKCYWEWIESHPKKLRNE